MKLIKSTQFVLKVLVGFWS